MKTNAQRLTVGDTDTGRIDQCVLIVHISGIDLHVLLFLSLTSMQRIYLGAVACDVARFKPITSEIIWRLLEV